MNNFKKVIEASNLSKVYRTGSISTGTFFSDLQHKLTRQKVEEGFYTALNDVSFSLKEGDVLGVVGKNGAGKSTLLKILSRITTPSSGSVKIHGRVSSLLEVGTGFHPELTGRENIFLNGTILGMTKKEISKRLDEIVDFSGVEKFLDTPVKRYSSGMIVRLGFSVAAHLEPDILIVDEVLAVGDAEFQAKCLDRLQKVSEHGRTVLFVSHNLASIKKLCNRAILLEKGSLVLDSTPEAVLEKYLGKCISTEDSGVSISDDHRQGIGGLRFEKIQLIGKGDGHKNILAFREPLRFNIHLKNTEQIRGNVFVSFTISNESFEKVAFSEKDLTKLVKGCSNDLGFSFVCNLGLILMPGSYVLNCSVHDERGNSYDYLENVVRFSVTSLADIGTESYIWERKVGDVYTNFEIERNV